MKRRKFNIVDLVIVIVVAALLLFGAYKLITGIGSGDVDTMKITYTVKVSAVEPTVYDSLKQYVPGELMASGEMVPGQVLSVTSAPSKYYTNIGTTDAPVPAYVERSDLLDLTFTIEADVEAGDVVIAQVGTQEVRIGKTHIVKTERFEMSGTVLTVEWAQE